MSDLWKWAVAAYARPGVATACLDLQDNHAVNVCYLLWAAWGEVEHRPLDLVAGASLAEAWEAGVSGPLRLARRNLKEDRPGVDPAVREGLRGDLKRTELNAERLLLDSLAALPSGRSRQTLEIAAALWRPAPDARAVERLHAALTNPVYGRAAETGA
jgi:uncharacterized protein (TIGR02444 family)